MLLRYHAESRVPTPQSKRRENPRYGDNIENRIDGQSLLADQGRLLALFRTTPMLNSPKNQAHLLTRDGSTTIAVESLLLNPRNYSRLDPLSEKHPKPGFSFVGTMKSIGFDYLSARQIVCRSNVF